MWLEDLRDQAKELAAEVKGEVKSVTGFDAYQGPRAIVHTPKHGDIEMWYDQEDDRGLTFNCKVAHIGWINGGINQLAEILNQDTIDDNEIISESEDTKPHKKADRQDDKLHEAQVKGLRTVKSQGNIYMLEDDNKQIIVGENYNSTEKLIENANIYFNKKEADKDYFNRCGITLEESAEKDLNNKSTNLYDRCYHINDREELKEIALNAIYVANNDQKIIDELNDRLVDLEKEECHDYLVKFSEAPYDFVANNYTDMPLELLREIALNAVYVANNDEAIEKEIKDRIVEYDETYKTSEKDLSKDLFGSEADKDYNHRLEIVKSLKEGWYYNDDYNQRLKYLLADINSAGKTEEFAKLLKSEYQGDYEDDDDEDDSDTIINLDGSTIHISDDDTDIWSEDEDPTSAMNDLLSKKNIADFLQSLDLVQDSNNMEDDEDDDGATDYEDDDDDGFNEWVRRLFN